VRSHPPSATRPRSDRSTRSPRTSPGHGSRSRRLPQAFARTVGRIHHDDLGFTDSSAVGLSTSVLGIADVQGRDRRASVLRTCASRRIRDTRRESQRCRGHAGSAHRGDSSVRTRGRESVTFHQAGEEDGRPPMKLTCSRSMSACAVSGFPHP
jgi:hypothetical protein